MLVFSSESTSQQFAFLIHQIQASEDIPVTITPPRSTITPPDHAANQPSTVPTDPERPGVWRSARTYFQTDPTGRVRTSPRYSFLVLPLTHALQVLRCGLITMTACLVLVPIVFAPSLNFLFVAALYSSFWMPQIVRSARRGRPSGLSMEYVIGTTVCRLILALCKSGPVFDVGGHSYWYQTSSRVRRTSSK